jgi:hypothetical protein
MTNTTKYKKFVFKFLWMSSLNKNKNMPIVITESTFYTNCYRKSEGGKAWKFTCYSILCMASISSYHTIIWRLILLLSFWSLCIVIWVQSRRSRRLKLATLLTLFFSLTHWSRMSYTCSIGDTSCDLVGHFNTLILLCRKTSLVFPAVCGRALSCWNIVTWPWFRNVTTSGISIPSQ